MTCTRHGRDKTPCIVSSFRTKSNVRHRTEKTSEIEVGTTLALESKRTQSTTSLSAHFSMATTDPSVPRSPSNLRVLVVDDNVDGAEALCALLASMGCTTAVAFKGSQGLAMAGAFDPHLALIDLEMPDMSGCDVARQLRAGRIRSSVKLICLTGHGQPEDRRLCLDAGFDDFFTKPMLPERLVEVVGAANAGLCKQ